MRAKEIDRVQLKVSGDTPAAKKEAAPVEPRCQAIPPGIKGQKNRAQ